MLTKKQKSEVENTKNEAEQTLDDLILLQEATTKALDEATVKVNNSDKKRSDLRIQLTNLMQKITNYRELIKTPEYVQLKAEEGKALDQRKKDECQVMACKINNRKVNRSIAELVLYIGVYVCHFKVGEMQLEYFGDIINTMLNASYKKIAYFCYFRYKYESTDFELHSYFYSNCDSEASIYDGFEDKEINYKLEAPKATTASNLEEADRVKEAALNKIKEIREEAEARLSELTLEHVSLD